MIDSERILFNRVGWMTYYGSEPSPELPVGGGEFNKREPENAAEGANFVLDDDGFAYGLIHTKTLNIRRLGVENNASYQSECTVVSVAPHPEHGLVIVGWQPKAEVTRSRRKHKTHASRLWNYRARIEHAVLLPIEERTHPIITRKGGMGQSMVFYSMSAGGVLVPWVSEVVQYMRDYAGPNLLKA